MTGQMTGSDTFYQSRVIPVRMVIVSGIGQVSRFPFSHIQRYVGTLPRAQRGSEKVFGNGKIEIPNDSGQRNPRRAIKIFEKLDSDSEAPGATGGARLGRPMHSRIFRVFTDGWIVARILRRPLQLEHFKTSISKTLAIKEAQA